MAEPALSEDHLDLVLEKMYQKKGWDFRLYRKSSLRRCIERRISFSRLPSREYIERLDSEPAEFHHLFNHITIKVSEFFRDLEVFNQIERHVIPATLEKLKSEGRDTLRIWSCGCARGEEPYSLAMLLFKALSNAPASFGMAGQESAVPQGGTIKMMPSLHFDESEDQTTGIRRSPAYQDRRGFRSTALTASLTPLDTSAGFNVKIFATDIDESSIEIARKGIFSEDSFTNLSPVLRDSFFKPLDTGFQVILQIRNILTFGVHNIVSNIHLSRTDILLCRNLLIYFEKDLQEKVFEKFFYSLNRGGFIILGKSEVVPSLFRDRFQEVFRKEKIYQKI